MSMEEDITQIIIYDDRGGGDGDVAGSEIQGILSKKVIINDEVKDIEDATEGH